MAQKITFKVTELITGPSGIKIEQVNFPTGKGDEKTEITEIVFFGKENKQIENAFELGKSYEVQFELSEVVEDNRTPTMTMHSATMAGGPDTIPPNKLFLEPDKKLRIVYNKHNDTLKFQEKEEEQTPPTPEPKKPKQPSPDEGPDSPKPKGPDQNPTPQAPVPKNPEPTSEEVNNAKAKLSQSQASDNKDTLKKALNETSEIVRRSSDQELKKSYKEVEDKLGQLDKEGLRSIIKEEVAKELQKLGLKKDDLSSESQQKLDELNNNNNNNNNISADQAKNLRTGVLNEAGRTALNTLINEVQQAIKSGDTKQIETKTKKLKQLTEDGSDEYVQNAYQLKKDDIKKLIQEAEKYKKDSSQNNKDNEGFFHPNNPLMWLSGAAIIGLVVGVVLVVRSRRKKSIVE